MLFGQKAQVAITCSSVHLVEEIVVEEAAPSRVRLQAPSRHRAAQLVGTTRQAACSNAACVLLLRKRAYLAVIVGEVW